MPDSFPAWTLTLGAMLDEGASIRVMCSQCRQWRDLDVEALVERVGRDYSLIGRRWRCRLTEGCRGYNKFAYLAGVYRPLSTAEDRFRWMG